MFKRYFYIVIVMLSKKIVVLKVYLHECISLHVQIHQSIEFLIISGWKPKKYIDPTFVILINVFLLVLFELVKMLYMQIYGINSNVLINYLCNCIDFWHADMKFFSIIWNYVDVIMSVFRYFSSLCFTICRFNPFNSHSRFHSHTH